MSTKKQELKDMAIYLFAEKGYHVTSIQEIVQNCHVSKGAFYKHFDSKENMLIEIIRDQHERMFDKAHSLHFSDALSSIEVLQKRITIELEEMQKSSSIFFIVLKEFPPADDSAVAAMMDNFRMELMEWHKAWFLEAFGEQNNAVIWDLIMIYEAIMKEYMALYSFQGITFSFDHLALMVTSVLEAAGDSVRTLDPVLTKEALFKQMSQEEDISVKTNLDEQLAQMTTRINHLSFPADKRDKLVQTVNHLTNEMHLDEPKMYLIEALIYYLKSEETLRNNTLQMEQTINKFFRGKGDA